MRLRNLRPALGLFDQRSAAPLPKRVDPHYQGAAHRQWREAVIERAGGRCQHPGCDRREPRMFADHIVERTDGGAPYDVANGQCLCGKHHTLKTHAERAKRSGLA